MIDLSNKIIRTETNDQSERLLRIAVAQGYNLPKGIKALIDNRTFKFIGFPYKTVSFPDIVPDDMIIEYMEVFGDEEEELREILERSTRFCRAHGYRTLRICADEDDTEYSGYAFAKPHGGGNIKAEMKLPKIRKVTIDEIEQRFGCPIEIAP